jgi:electron transfer DM13
VHPNAVRSGLMSTRAVLLNAGLLAGWLLLSFVLLPRVLHKAVARSAVLTAIAIAAVAVLVVPTLRDKKVVEAFPMPSATVAHSSAKGDVGTSAPTASTTAAAPVRVSTGALHGIDHDASGTASVYRLPAGSYVVGLEGIDIEPGPDYQVYVVPGVDRETPGDGTHLAGLRGNQGTQYYEVPRDAGDVGDGWTVLVWCRAFGVPVAAATQESV